MNLNTTALGVKTITYAVMARKLLRKQGIQSKLVKLDSTKMKNGCAYAIEIYDKDFLGAVAVLRKNQIYYTVISPDGQ